MLTKLRKIGAHWRVVDHAGGDNVDGTRPAELSATVQPPSHQRGLRAVEITMTLSSRHARHP